MRHPIKATARPTVTLFLQRDAATLPQWPSFTGTAQFVGTTASGRVTVYVDPTTGQSGLQNAQDLLNDADRVVSANDQLFGTTGGPVSVVVFALDGATDGSGGADHMGCDYATGAAIEVCASYGNSARVSALFEAELSECSMGGNLCGVSTGEALSRWCAAVIGNNALGDFATAPAWARDGMADYVNQTDPTDRGADSTGCGMAFISWLMSTGADLGSIARTIVAGGDTGTLADLYAQLLTWDAADISANALYGGDLPRALRAIRARVLLMPGETDLYFRVADNTTELPCLASADLKPIPSIWGHRAGNPVPNPDDARFVKHAVRDWLAR